MLWSEVVGSFFQELWVASSVAAVEIAEDDEAAKGRVIQDCQEAAARV
jgi:hypothetical protein